MPLRRTIPCALLLCASAASGSPFEATLTLEIFGEELRFVGSGNGYNTPALVTLPGGTFSGTLSEEIYSMTELVLKLVPGGSGSFTGSPSPGRCPCAACSALGGSSAAVPLNSGYDIAAFGVGGSVWAPLFGDQTLRRRAALRPRLAPGDGVQLNN